LRSVTFATSDACLDYGLKKSFRAFNAIAPSMNTRSIYEQKEYKAVLNLVCEQLLKGKFIKIYVISLNSLDEL
jgi:hypothetical protein